MGLDRAPTIKSVPLIVRSKLARAPWRKFSTLRNSKVAMAIDKIVKMAVKRRAHKDFQARVMTLGSVIERSLYLSLTDQSCGQNEAQDFHHG